MIGPSARGAEMTRPSSTIANRLVGSGIVYSRVVTLRNLSAPLLLKFSRTSQVVDVPPFWVGCSPAVALAMSLPSTSTGPRMYFSPRSCEQVTSGFFGSSVPPCSAEVSVQSSATNRCSIAGVIQRGSLAFVGAGVGVAPPVGVTLGFVVALGVVVAVLARTRACGRPRWELLLVGALLAAGADGVPEGVPVGVPDGVGAGVPDGGAGG